VSASQVALGPAVAERLLEELIYERVRAHLDLLELGLFEADLDLSIRRILDDLDRTVHPGDDDATGDAPSAVLATALIDRAWERVAAEWAERGSEHEDEEHDECPICEQMALDEELGDLAARSMRRPRAQKAATR
jgi:hypothetical protein